MTQHETAKRIAEMVASDANTQWFVHCYEEVDIDQVKGVVDMYVGHLTGRIVALLKEAEE